MRVRMLTSMVGPSVNRRIGDELDVEEDEGARLVERGYAKPVRKQRQTTRKDAPERATVNELDTPESN